MRKKRHLETYFMEDFFNFTAFVQETIVNMADKIFFGDGTISFVYIM